MLGVQESLCMSALECTGRPAVVLTGWQPYWMPVSLETDLCRQGDPTLHLAMTLLGTHVVT